MATKAGTAVFKIALDAKQYKVAIKGIQKSSKKTATSLRGISQAVNVAIFAKLGRVAVDAIKSVVGAIADLGVRGAGVDDVATSFGVLSEKTGETADVMLNKLQAGVKGTLSDFDLMSLSNKALGAGLVKSSDDMGVLATGARQLAKATGGETKQAFDTMLTAIASGRTAQLKQLGLFVDSKVATENFAAAHGKTVAQLTDADRAQALGAATLAALRDRLKELPPQAADFGELLDAVKVTMTNFTDALAVGISKSPVLGAGLEALGQSLSGAFGSDSQGLITTVVGLIERVAIAMVKGARIVVEGAGFILKAWEGTKVALNAYWSFIVGGIGMLITAMAGVIEKAAQLPVVGAQFQGVADGVRALGDDLTHLSGGFKAQARASLSSIASIDEGTAKVSNTLIVMEDSMRKAGTASQDAATEIREVGLASQQAAAQGAAAAQQAAAEIERLAKQRAAEAQAAATLIVNTERTLQQQLALAQAEGLQKRQLKIQFAREKELEKIASLREGYAVEYEQLATMVKQKYDEIRADAQAAHMSIQAAANEQGFKTREQLEETARKAEQTYRRMLASGKFTIDTLENAHQASEEAKRQITGGTVAHADVSLGAMVSSATGALRDLFGQNKAVAIATAIADTAAAVVASFKNAGGWPWGLIPAAAMAAAGAKRISTIRSTDPGFKFGTPGLDFQNFGMVTPTFLHRQEAVIPRGRGHLLAGEIAAAMPGADVMQLAELRGIRDELTRLPRAIGRQVRQGMLLSQ